VLGVPDLPGPADLALAPAAVAHEGHQVAAAAGRIRAAARVGAIRVLAVGDLAEARAIAPRTEAPVQLAAPLATRAARRVPRLAPIHAALHPAPRAGQHALGDRAIAAATAVAELEGGAVAAHELALADRLPVAFLAGLAAPASHARREQAVALPQALEGRPHLGRVREAPGLAQIRSALEQSDEVRMQVALQLVDDARGRPVVGPLRELSREDLDHDQAEREHVGLERGPAHGLFGRHVAHGPGSGGQHGSGGQARDPEVREPQPVVPEQNEVLGLQVAVDDAVGVGMGHRLEHLADQGQAGLCTHPALHAVAQGLAAQGIRDHEAPIDELGVLDGQDVGVVEARGEPDLLAKDLEHLGVHELSVRHLESHPDALDLVVGPIHLGEAALGQALLDPVLAECLLRPEHDPSPAPGRSRSGLLYSQAYAQCNTSAVRGRGRRHHTGSGQCGSGRGWRPDGGRRRPSPGGP
jgi:hypothetical protein